MFDVLFGEYFFYDKDVVGVFEIYKVDIVYCVVIGECLGVISDEN